MTNQWHEFPDNKNVTRSAIGRHLEPDDIRIAKEIQDILLGKVDLNALLAQDTRARRAQIENVVQQIIDEKGIRLQQRQHNTIVRYILDEALGYGPLSTLVADPSITEIMVNGPNNIFIERNGELEKVSEIQFFDETHLRNLVDRIVSQVGRRIDEASPHVDARLPDGSRVNIIIHPLSLNGPTLTIRKFQDKPLSLDDLVNKKALSPEMADFLREAVCARLSIIVSGGTGSGKTTLLNALALCINDCERKKVGSRGHERLITIEDSAELQFYKQYEHVVRMEARPANVQGAGEVTIRELVRNALRMRPDRIIVGEVRGAEALDMIQAMNTGHEGSMTTVHANSPEAALKRIETMTMWAEGAANLPLQAIREQIVNAVNLIVQTSRGSDGQRRIVAISEVQELRHGDITVKDIFRFYDFPMTSNGSFSAGMHDATGVIPKCADRLDLPQDRSRQTYRSRLIEKYLGNWLKDPQISEIMINGVDEAYIEKGGQIEPAYMAFDTEGQLSALIETIIAPIGRRIDARHPMVDARLPDGSRVNAVIRPVSQVGPTITIRRFPDRPLEMTHLVEKVSLSEEMSNFLRACVEARLNILVSGGTGSGKTTLLNALSRYIPPDNRIITIEDVAELRLRQEHWISLETRSTDEYGEGEVTIRDLVRNALRMRPDRIIVGEVRGAEALDMLQAMNTGHEGSMTTIHANTPLDAFSRLETMVAWAGTELPSQAIRAQIVGALDIIVQTSRVKDGKRRITSIAGVVKDRKLLSVVDLFTLTLDNADESGDKDSTPFMRHELTSAQLAQISPGVQHLWSAFSRVG